MDLWPKTKARAWHFAGLALLRILSKLDAAVPYDAWRAQGDVVETVLAVHEGRDNDDRTLITENCLADARDTGCDGEAGVAFEAGDLRAGVADACEKVFLTGEIICSRADGGGDLRRRGQHSTSQPRNLRVRR
jgi:hypothetical protein